MRAVMYEQIPTIGDERARNYSSTGNQIDERETNPYLPKDRENRFVRICMMQSVLR